MADPMMALRLEVVKTFSNDLENCLKNITVRNQTMFYIFIFFNYNKTTQLTDYFNFTLQEMEEKRDGVLLRIDDLVSETEGERRGLTAIKREMMLAVRSYLF